METRPQNEQYTYLTVTVYGNSVVTIKFPTKGPLEMIDSSVKNLRKVECNKQNSLRHQKIQVLPQNSK
jgi:hypothetical protein